MKAKSPVSKTALLWGKESKNLGGIGKMLSHLGLKVCRLVDGSYQFLPASGPLDLAVIADGQESEGGEQLARQIRVFFPGARILYLYNNLDPKQERSLRQVGVIFLGTYESFKIYGEEIIRAALKIADLKPALPYGSSGD